MFRTFVDVVPPYCMRKGLHRGVVAVGVLSAGMSACHVTELRVFTVVAFCAAWNGGGVL